jgi:predicted HicB family RNase H-like nuclease
MSALLYKDFQGSVEFEDGRLIIRILHIDYLVTTEIESASNAQTAFEELVDDYLETCAQLGKKPSKPFKGSINVRIPVELHRKVAMAAADIGESMNSWIADALRAYVERQKAKKAIFDRQFVRRVIHRAPVTTAYTQVKTLQVRKRLDTDAVVLPLRRAIERQRASQTE